MRHVVVSALGRLAGIALLGLALTSWPGPSAWFVTPAMLVYNLLATVYLGYLGLVAGNVGRIFDGQALRKIVQAMPHQQEGLLDMRSHLRVSIILVVSLVVSTATVAAQTGEFVATVPGAVVHEGYALQDQWQNARNRAPAGEPVGAVKKSKPRRVESQQAMRSRHNK